MTKQPVRLLIAALLLGWVFDFLFWEKYLGVNFAIFLGLCLLGGLGLLISYGLKPARKSLLLIIPVVFFGVMSVVRLEPVTRFLTVAFSLLSIGLLTVTYLGGRWMRYGLFDYLSNAFHLLGSIVASAFLFFGQVRKERVEQGTAKIDLPIRPVFRGLAIALPVVLLFAALLGSADLVFQQKLNDFVDQFEFDNLFENITRLLIILGVAYGLMGAILHSADHSRDEKLMDEGKPARKPLLGFTESSIVLGSVAALFLAFVVIQFQYFFGGQANIGVEGFTYSQYARRGFNELVIVAFLSLLLILGLSTITCRESELEKRIYSGLSVVLAGLVLVMLVSAFQRLSLAIAWHGFSRLRLYPRVFLIWVGILFVVVVALEVFRRERYFAFASLLAAMGFAVSLSLINVDAEIVHYNVLRANQGKHFNVNHLTALSPDAVPAIVEEFKKPLQSARTRNGLGAALLCYLHTDSIPMEDVDWRDFNLSQWQARQALEEVQDKLKDYKVNDDQYLVRVRAPKGPWFDCAQPNSASIFGVRE